jgi:hypothetical protein
MVGVRLSRAVRSVFQAAFAIFHQKLSSVVILRRFSQFEGVRLTDTRPKGASELSGANQKARGVDYSESGAYMPVYSYIISGPSEQPPLEFELETDDSAIALSICVLRDEPEASAVWVMDGETPVALRMRSAKAEAGVALRLR